MLHVLFGAEIVIVRLGEVREGLREALRPLREEVVQLRGVMDDLLLEEGVHHDCRRPRVLQPFHAVDGMGERSGRRDDGVFQIESEICRCQVHCRAFRFRIREDACLSARPVRPVAGRAPLPRAPSPRICGTAAVRLPPPGPSGVLPPRDCSSSASCTALPCRRNPRM